MSLVHVKDEGGQSLPLFDFRGIKFPSFPPEAITEYPDLSFRHDDILICSAPKSGVHWVQEITRLLVKGTIEDDMNGKEKYMIELQRNCDLDDLDSPRILNTHINFRDLPQDVHEKKCKILYLNRNPKDALVSMYNFILKLPQQNNYHGKWEDFLKMAMEGKAWYGAWWDSARAWEEDMEKNPDANILTLWYEDLVEDTTREIRRINKFLGYHREEEFIKSVRKYVTFGNMKAIKTAKLQNSFQDVIFRKGHVGDWRNWFTVTQSEEFDEKYQTMMKGSSIRCRFTLPKNQIRL